MRLLLLAACSTLLCGCLGYPDNVEPVEGFELPRYLGKWYEIARLDHSFERGLQNVTAQYSQQDDGSVKVVNQGFDTNSGNWNTAEGIAHFVESPATGYLKVSFFGPFYGSYVVFELDKNDYEYAFVTGPSHSYLWLLSRTPRVSADLKEHFIATADKLGYNTQNLIFVDHSAR
tara:strand:- start:432133 stop:432654 length:522 start_codon:yes stop_codon:yes gene_type:complete